jgi:hypothetical protein
MTQIGSFVIELLLVSSFVIELLLVSVARSRLPCRAWLFLLVEQSVRYTEMAVTNAIFYGAPDSQS